LVAHIPHEPEGGGGEVDADPDPAPGVLGRGLEEVAGDDHGGEAGEEGEAAPAALADAARVTGFHPRRTVVELLGRCLGCAAAEG